MWQFRVYFNRERGLINPFDPIESTQKAIELWYKNYAALGDIDRAITAHKHGLTWARRHGIDQKYVARVKGEYVR
jgi:hypothetical protein